MTVSIQNVQQATSEYQYFQSAYSTAANALAGVISTGTVLHNDATMPSLFPNSWSAYQTYLVNLGNAINTFIASLPAIPPLNG